MPHPGGYAPGTFCWADVATTDAAASCSFYTALFGWQAEDGPTPGGGTYTTYLKGGRPAAGGAQLADPVRALGVPSHWMSYVAVEDAGATLAAVARAGGLPMGPPIPVGETGTMAVFTDPTGAACGLWQAGGFAGAGVANEPGSLIWNELLTADPERAAAFYTAVFGWRHEARQSPDGPSHLFMDGPEHRAGMMAITPEMGDLPPHWSVYFAVAGIDAAAGAVTALGGRIEGGVMESSPFGRFAVAADPTGASFVLIEPAGAG